MSKKQRTGLKVGTMYVLKNGETSTTFQELTEEELQVLKEKYPNSEEVKE